MDQIIDPKTLLTGTGAIILLSTAIWAFYKELVVPGSVYKRDIGKLEAEVVRLRNEKEEMWRFAVRATNVAELTQRTRGGGFIGTQPTDLEKLHGGEHP